MDDPSDPDDAPPEGTAALRAAAATWMRRGYRERYRDAFLIQLLRRRGLGWRSAPYVALAVASLGLAAAAWIAALRRRPWHVITLTIGPDSRILTHSHTAPRPPAP
ncbi:MAG: hypothetical protein ACRDHP_17940 [Ktedonobacterales bacterium]